MKNRVALGSFVASMIGGLFVACTVETENNGSPTTNVDAGVVAPKADAGEITPIPIDDTDGGGMVDAATPGPSAISPRSTTRIPNAINPYGLTWASDGLLYTSGATIDGADRKLAVWRFKDDGLLDTTFGDGGKLTVAVPGTNVASFGLEEVTPGNFVVQAVSGGKVYLLKLTKSGDTFALGTPVAVPFAWADGDLTGWPGANPPAYNSWGIAIDRTNTAAPKVVVFASGAPAKAASGVQRVDADRWVARLDATTLAPDPTFNGGVAYTTDVDGKAQPDNTRRGLVLADGSIVSAGYTSFDGANAVVLLKLTPAGAPDPAFNFGTATAVAGQAKFNPFASVNGFSEAYGIARQSTGRFVTTGYGTSNFNAPSASLDLVAFGVKAAGDGLDPAFGKLGAFAIQSEKDPSGGLGATAFQDRGRDVVVLPDDRTVHVGLYDNYASIFVLDPNGKLDPSTGTNGILRYAYPGNFFEVAVSADGKKIAATTDSLNQTTDAGAPVGSVLVTLSVGQ